LFPRDDNAVETPPFFRHLRHHHGYKHNEKRRKNKGKSKGELSARG
jgi:hypothetical protein